MQLYSLRLNYGFVTLDLSSVIETGFLPIWGKLRKSVSGGLLEAWPLLSFLFAFIFTQSLRSLHELVVLL